MTAACSGQGLVERWNAKADSLLGHAVAVGYLPIAEDDGYVYTFGEQSNGLDTSGYVLRRNDLQDGGNAIEDTWPVSDDAELRKPVGMVVMPRSIIPGTEAEREPLIIVTGTDPNQGRDDIVIIAYSKDLAIRWMKTYSNDTDDNPVDDAPVAIIADDGSDSLYVVGWSDSNGVTSTSGRDTVVLHLQADDGDMTVMDRYSSSGALSDAPAGATLAGGLLYTVGTTAGGTNSTLFFLKHDPLQSPARVWATTHEDPGYNVVGVGIDALEVVGGYHIYATGYKGPTALAYANDWITMAVNTDTGVLRWITSNLGFNIQVSGDDRPADLAGVHYKTDLPNGYVVDGVAVTGYTYDTGKGNRMTTVHYKDNWDSAELRWAIAEDGAVSGGDDRGLQVAARRAGGFGNQGFIYITGKIEAATGNHDILTVKYGAYNPTLYRWPKEYPQSGSGDGDDIPLAIRLDEDVYDSATGFYLPSLIVGGMAFDAVGSASAEDLITIRYVDVGP
ncbi:MAG: hypothetical protein IT437_03015 [Phycisphaerales bacterium]|nr:hypothetical protein [Phycisphaerales bacterium]